MAKFTISKQTAAVIVVATSMAIPAQAFELSGLWASDTPACAKIFATQGKRSSIRKDSDIYGSGFIIEGNRIKGRMANCSIKSRKEDGSVIHLMTSCATDIMLANVQFSVKVLDDNRITRIFPGIEGMEISYVRCPPGEKQR